MSFHTKKPRRHSAIEVLSRIKQALLAQRSLSLIRLGNGELLAIAHSVLVPLSRIESWLEYAGVKLPSEAVRQDLLNAVRDADIVGITTDMTHWDCAPLAQRVINHFHLNPKYYTDAAINWQLHQFNRLYQALSNVPTILVGRKAQEAAPILGQKGVNIVALYNLEDYNALVQTEAEISQGPPFRVALVAAGIPATILCPRLAKKMNVIAIDYGHVINDLIKPGFNVNDLPEETMKWFQNRKNHQEIQ